MIAVRQTRVEISVGGADATAGLAPFLERFSHSDSIAGKSDSISLVLYDQDWQMLRQWVIAKGTEIRAKIIQENVPGQAGRLELDCGLFFADEVHFSISDKGGATLTIKANSVPCDGSCKGTKKYKAWEGADLQTITEQVAGESNLGMQWEVQKPSTKLSRVDQDGESDLELFERLLGENGHRMKVTNRKVVVFNEADYEAREPIFNIRPGSGYSEIRLTTKAEGTCKSAKISWVSPRTGKLVEEIFEPSEPPEGVGAESREYERYNRDGEDDEDDFGDDFQARNPVWDVAEGDAARKAKGKNRAKEAARKANRGEWQCSLRMPGNVKWAAGLTFTLSQDFGPFGRKFICTEVSHHVDRSAGYSVDVAAHATLKGY